MSRLIGKLNLHVAQAAKVAIQQLLARGEQPECWPMLGLAIHIGEEIGYWRVGRYYAKNLDGLAPLYDGKGIPLLYECNGVTFAIPQTQLLSRLDGATLDFNGREYILNRTV